MKQNLKSNRSAGNTLAAVVLLIVVVAVIALVGIAVWRHRNSVVPVHENSNITPSSSTGSSAPPTISSGSGNANLQSDLTSVNQSLNLGSQNLQSANSGVNDQPIVVPTN